MKNFLLFFFSITVGIVQAQWISDSTLNNPIATGNLVNSRNSLVSIPSGDGGMFLAWEDTTNTNTIGTNVYLQKINGNGTVAFAANGLAVTNISGSQTNISMVSDGAGGVILAWQDNRFNSRTDIYGQRVLSNGTFAWTDGGKALTDTLGLQQAPYLCAASNGEVFMLYRSSLIDFGSTTSYDLYATRINITTGNYITPKVIANGNNIQTAESIQPDLNGGAFILWQDPYKSTSESDIQIQRINNNLDTLWSGLGCNGIVLCNAVANQLAPSMAVDATGVTVAWGDLRASSTNAEIYAQRVNFSGVAQWATNGVVVCNAAGNQTNVKAVRSNGGTILVWGDNRVSTSNRDIYAQKVSDVDGSTMWTVVNGTPISIATGNQPNSTTSGFNVLSDGSNGAYIVWDDARRGSSDVDVRAQLINSAGAIQWTFAVDGAAVAVATGSNQNQPTVAATTGGIIVAWRDSRTATGAEIYTSRLYATTGLLPVRFLNVRASLKNNDGLVQWKVANEVNVAHYEIEKSSNGVEFEIIGTAAAKRVDAYEFADKKLLLGNNYYRIKAVDNDGKTSYSDVVFLKQNIVAAFAISVLPNPAINDIKVQAYNLETGNYSIRIIQNNGSVVKEQRFNNNSTFTTVTVPISIFAKGAYMLVISNSKGENVYSTQIQKL